MSLPFTDLIVVANRTACPSRYTPVWKAHDTQMEIDLWRDGLFSKKTNRFICFTKDYPLNNQYNVIEDIKLLNENESLNGFQPILKCEDTSEKTFQKKVLWIKISYRFFTNTAVDDLIFLAKTKRPPSGYSYIGEINGLLLCIRFAPIPNNDVASASAQRPEIRPNIPPPIPPRPGSGALVNGEDDGFIMVNTKTPSPPGQPAQQRHMQSQHSLTGSSSANVYNPLQGVPFEINPAYRVDLNPESRDDMNELINRKLDSFKTTLEKMSYNFSLERSCV